MSTPTAIAVILTYNEEKLIADTVKNARTIFKNVYVLDSFSTDNTVSLAIAAGANVIENKFLNFSAQRNFAIEQLETKYNWLFFLDADEEISPTLGENIIQIINRFPVGPCAYKMKRENVFLGKVLKYAAGKDFQTRLFGNFENLRYSGEVHEGVVSSKLNRTIVSGCITHKDTNSISQLFEKTNKYTSVDVFKKKRFSTFYLVLQLLFVPTFRFLKSYIKRCGFLDGYRGFIFSSFAAIYKFVLITKQIERNLKSQ